MYSIEQKRCREELRRIYEVNRVISGSYIYSHLMLQNIQRKKREAEEKRMKKRGKMITTDNIQNAYGKPELEVGEKVRIALFDVDTETREKKKRVVKATVVGIYPHHALLDIGGIKESFTYWDIWQMMRQV